MRDEMRPTLTVRGWPLLDRWGRIHAFREVEALCGTMAIVGERNRILEGNLGKTGTV